MSSTPRSDGSAWSSLLLGAPATFLAAHALVHPGGVALLSAVVSAGAIAVMGRLARGPRLQEGRTPESEAATGAQRCDRWYLAMSISAVVVAASGLWLGRPLIATLAAAVAYGITALAWARCVLAQSRAPREVGTPVGNVDAPVHPPETERVRELTDGPRVLDEARTVERIVVMGSFDWVSSHDLVVVGSDFEYPVGPGGRARTLRVLERLLRDGLMVPGDLGDTGFADWPGSASEWTDRARTDLDRLSWSPMGDGFWLRLTERGVQVAERSEEVL
ncbi:hypothetical protein [Cellulomonas sp. NPDC058312]|uniref:hypothetical protein n=1 Tax=Cellulomonas sp. NPDC058312 TaxID=3346441 RepID=UPI0036F0A760